MDEPSGRVGDPSNAGVIAEASETQAKDGAIDHSVRSYSIPWGAMGTRGQRVLYLVAYWIVGSFFLQAHFATLALFLPLGAFLFFSLRGFELKIGDDGVVVAGVFFSYENVRLNVGTEPTPFVGRLSLRPPPRGRRRGKLKVVVDPAYLQLYIPSGRSWRLSLEDSQVGELEKDLRARHARFMAQPALIEIPAALSAAEDAPAAPQIRTLRENLVATSYRGGAVTPETLWRVAENPRTAPRLRVAATAALATLANDADRLRLRVLASSTADEAMREQLELAVDPKRDDELFAALDRDR